MWLTFVFTNIKRIYKQVKQIDMKRELRELVILLTDAYKLHHREMYPKNTVTVYSNGTPRASRHYKGKNKDYVVVWGIQRLTRKLVEGFDEFFKLPSEEVVTFVQEQLSSFTGAKYAVDHIKYLHGLQKLPLVIKALPEGTKCPIKVPYMTFYNTDPKCFWITNYLETFISCEIWSSITNATIANEYREIFDEWAIETVGNTDFVPLQGHDFSMRGMFGSDAARTSGLAHLTSFCGSDTIPSYIDAQHYYDSGQNKWENFPKGIVATSVPATEHSVQCAHFNPKDGNELKYLDHILDTFEDAPVVSIVCDGYDFWEFLTVLLPQRKDKILARKGKLVVRPDSGNPADIICGVPSTTVSRKDIAEYEYRGAVQVLFDIFGGEVNDKGFIELDPHIGLIYGDSITLELADEVCQRLAEKRFASTNWVAGIGSYTYQFNTRDSHGQAIKATYIEIDTGYRTFGLNNKIEKLRTCKNIYKDPKTGDGMKKSAKGLLAVHVDYDSGGELILADQVTWEEEGSGRLQIVLEDGVLKNQVTLQEVRKRLHG